MLSNSGERLCLVCNQTYPGDQLSCPSDKTPLIAIFDHHKEADSVPGYALLDLAGRGASSKVYKGQHIETGKIVAIKILHQTLATSLDLVRRFKKEAELSSRLSSPHTVALNNFGLLSDGRPYMVMEHIDGVPAHLAVTKPEKFSLQRALPIFIQIADGLAHAHDIGIVHRDIKPSNIMLLEAHGMRDFVKIVDFGIAKMWSHDSSMVLTREGEAVGSPMYMSPEQCMGTTVDQRTDIYSLGCLMYEMLTGRLIFTAEDPMKLMGKHISEMPPPMALSDSPASLEMERIVTKALAKNPKNRHVRAMQLKFELQAVLCSL